MEISSDDKFEQLPLFQRGLGGFFQVKFFKIGLGKANRIGIKIEKKSTALSNCAWV